MARGGKEYHVSDVNVHQVDRKGKGPNCKNAFSGRQTTNNTYTAVLMLHSLQSHPCMETTGKGLQILQRELRLSAKT